MTESTSPAAPDTTQAAGNTEAATLQQASSLLTDGDGGSTGATDAGTKPADEGGDATKAEGKPAGSDDAANGAPETYADFTLPEGVALDAAVVDETKALAKELNLSQENAQKVADLLAKTNTTSTAAFEARQAEAVKGVTEGWVAEVRNDKEVGGEKLAENLAKARDAMEATTTPQLRELLKRTGLGNNVEVIRHFLKIAPAFSETKHVPGTNRPAGAQKTAAEVLYPQS